MFTFNCKGRLLVIDRPVVMGIINVSPDSFFNDNTIISTESIVAKAATMLKDGATILDIGGQTSKPGSGDIGYEEEIKRALPAINAIRSKFPESFISIDTYHAEVAKAAVDAGADIVNDISAGSIDQTMLETVAKLQVPYIAMHMKGNPATMALHTAYEDLLLEILEYFIEKTNECAKAGISDVIIDPGFGFAKNAEQNLTILRNLNIFKILQKPILAGLSRKSTIYKTLGITAEESLNGTTVLNTIALQNGASILRVHDVKEAMQTIQLLEKYKG